MRGTRLDALAAVAEKHLIEARAGAVAAAEAADARVADAPQIATAASTSAATPPLPVGAATGGLVTPRPRHQCSCGMSFNRSLNYLHHISQRLSAACSSENVVLYVCPYDGCCSAFRRKTDRSKHVSCVHTKLRPFKCEIESCTSAFFFHKDMRKHVSTVHLRERPFVCDRCGQAFGKKEHMTNHVNRTHLHIKPFGCKICGVKLASKHTLLSHVKTRAHRRAIELLQATGVEAEGMGEARGAATCEDCCDGPDGPAEDAELWKGISVEGEGKMEVQDCRESFVRNTAGRRLEGT